MGVGKTNIEYRSKWKRNILLMNPRFLSEEESGALDSFLAYLEDLVDKPKAEYNPETILKIFPSVRLARGVEHVLLRDYYSFVSLPLEALPRADSERLLARGIDEPYKLRLVVTEKVNKTRDGFVTEEEREETLKEVASELGVNLASIEKVLWLDGEDEKILTRLTESPPRSKELLPILNFHILESILKCSTLVTLWIEGQFSGTVAKKLYWVCKKSGILCEFSREENTLRIELIGPEEVVGKKEKYGRLIAPVFFNLAAFLRESHREFRFEIELFLFSRERAFRGTEEILENILIPEESARLFRDFISEYDSNVEKRFDAEFKSERGDRKGWSLLVEPEIVVMGPTIFIPDFALSRNGETVFLEIVGFWTESYKAKKLAKLAQLKKKGMKNLILLVNNEFRKEFTEKITGFPVIYYSKRFPMHSVMETLETHFSTFEMRKTQVLSRIDVIIRELLASLRDSKTIVVNDLHKAFDCYHQGELKEIMATDSIKTRLAQEGLVFIESVGILLKSVLNDLKITICQTISQTGAPLSKIDALIRNEDLKFEDPTRLLRRMGFQVVWKALDAPRVILPEQPDPK